jgi:hypothetical protein
MEDIAACGLFRPIFEFRPEASGFDFRRYAFMLIPRTALNPSPSASHTVGCA